MRFRRRRRRSSFRRRRGSAGRIRRVRIGTRF